MEGNKRTIRLTIPGIIVWLLCVLVAVLTSYFYVEFQRKSEKKEKIAKINDVTKQTDNTYSIYFLENRMPTGTFYEKPTAANNFTLGPNNALNSLWALATWNNLLKEDNDKYIGYFDSQGRGINLRIFKRDNDKFKFEFYYLGDIFITDHEFNSEENIPRLYEATRKSLVAYNVSNGAQSKEFDSDPFIRMFGVNESANEFYNFDVAPKSSSILTGGTKNYLRFPGYQIDNYHGEGTITFVENESFFKRQLLKVSLIAVILATCIFLILKYSNRVEIKVG